MLSHSFYLESTHVDEVRCIACCSIHADSRLNILSKVTHSLLGWIVTKDHLGKSYTSSPVG